MDHPVGAASDRGDRVNFDRRVRLQFRSAQISSDGGLLVMRELDDALGLSDLASAALRDTRRGKNTVHRLDGLFRQSVFGRLAEYEDVNDADRLALDPVMRQVVGGRAVDAQAASASHMGRFETETLALRANREALADLNGQWIDRFHDRDGLKYIVLDMDSSVSPTHGDQEGSTWNGHFDCTCYHPLFLFNQFGMLESCAPRHGNVHIADKWQDVLDPVIARYAGRKLGGRFLRADAAYASPAIYARPEEAGYLYAIRLPANAVLREKIAHRLSRPVGRPSLTKVKRFYENFQYQAASWGKPRRVIAKVEWHRASFSPRWASSSPTFPWTRTGWCGSTISAAPPSSKSRKAITPSTGRGCHASGSATTRSGCNCTRWPTISRPSSAASSCPRPWPDWSLTSLQLKLIKIGARVVRHARAITFQLAEVAVTGPMVRAILAAIRRIRAPPLCA
jgi:hypothetical protein